jgi:hypothetical protein
MPAPLNPNLWPSVLHDENGNPINALNPLPVAAIISPSPPGTIINSVPDTAVGALATVPLTAPPAGTRRMTIQNTGPANSRIRVRQVGGAAGSGVLLTSLGSTTYGGADGALAALEAEDVTANPGQATTVGMTFEEN